MRNLADVIRESLSLDKASNSYNAASDQSKIITIEYIMKAGIDDILGDKLRADSEDEAYNEKMHKLQQSFKDILSHLEKDGLIQINGFRIQKLRNI